MTSRIIDISPPVRAGSPVWPGDSEFELSRKWSIAEGDSVTVGTVTTTTHIGAHIDAPAHVVDGAPPIDGISLDACLGPCLIVDVSDLVDREATPHGPAPAHAVAERIQRLATGAVERVLLRHYPALRLSWDPELPGIDPELIRWFAAQGGRLIGLDLASFDPAESKSLEAHRAGIEGDVVLLEGLDLSAAPVGAAELIALPLSWPGADASPVRAVLRVPIAHEGA